MAPALCQCGCGRETPLATRTNASRGHVKGKPLRFLSGHHFEAPLEERFWMKVMKTDGCWLWTGAKDGQGYGQIWDRQTQRLLAAHRLSWTLTHGAPKGDVLHRCDTPACVRPEHLFLGDQRTNNADMVAKRRHRGAPGEAHANARLSDAAVTAIRQAYRPGTRDGSIARARRDLANRFGVSVGQVAAVQQGRCWRHVSGGAR